MDLALVPIWWLFAPSKSRGAGRSLLWWEARRLPVNLVIGIYGVTCLVIFLVAICTSGVLQPGDDPVEPIAIIVAPFIFNICYTLGWIVEVLARAAVPDLSPRFGPLLLMLGLGFSVCVISLPAVYWVGYRFLQLAGVMK